MQLAIHVVDAFTDRVFRGNPAAVVPLAAWLPDDLLQAIAAENALSETAYLVREGAGWRIRWFTPRVEVALCGHATLASAHVVLTRLTPGAARVEFTSKSGPLVVTQEGDLLVLDFPTQPAETCATPTALIEALGREPIETRRKAHSYLAVYERAEEVVALAPDMARVAALDRASVIATAPGTDCDFVSRFFAPSIGIPEDPVTGSAHCTLVPYWSARLGRARLRARQVSQRGGELWCEDRGERVRIGGRAAHYLEGTIDVPEAVDPARVAGGVPAASTAS
jgi:PhzF family phenazine biosynthesis protein